MKRNRRSRKKNRFYSALVAMLMVVALAGSTVSTGMAAEISGDAEAGQPAAYTAVDVDAGSEDASIEVYAEEQDPNAGESDYDDSGAGLDEGELAYEIGSDETNGEGSVEPEEAQSETAASEFEFVAEYQGGAYQVGSDEPLSAEDFVVYVYDADGNLVDTLGAESVSSDYEVDEDGYILALVMCIYGGETITVEAKIAAIKTLAGEEAFAVYSADDNSFTFYYDEVPETGTDYNGKTATTVYTGMEDARGDEGEEASPYKDVAESVKSVTFDASFAAARPVDTSYWFCGFKYCTEFNGLRNLNTSEVTSIDSMFQNCEEVTSLDVGGWDVSNVTVMRGVFSLCYELSDLDVSGWDVSSVTKMNNMFYDCDSLTTIDVSGWDTGSMIHMAGLFRGSGITSMDITRWDTSGVQTMNKMFSGCDNLTSLSISGIDTSSVTDMSNMFDECKSLETLDLRGFNTKNVETFERFAYDCESLQWISFGDDFDLFARSTLDMGMVSTQNWYDGSGDLVSENYMVGFTGGAGTYYTTPVEEDESGVFAIYSGTDHSLTFYQDESGRPAKGDTYNGKEATEVFVGFDSLRYRDEYVPWHLYRESIQSVVVDKSFDDVEPFSTAYWFYDLEHCTSFDLEYLDTSGETEMEDMFYGCSSVTELDLSSFDTSNVTNMSQMFRGCSSLTSVDFSSFDTSGVTNMQGMFQGCSSFTAVDLSYFDTSSVTTMNTMFRDCTGLTEIDVTPLKMATVENIGQMFQGCTSLTELDLSSFETDSLTTMANVVNGCTNLETLNLRGWDTSNATGMASEFANCPNLQTIFVNEGDFDTSHYRNDTNMFHLDYSILGQNGTTYDENNYQHEMANIDTADNPGYLTNYAMFAVYSADDHSLTFYADQSFPQEGGDYNGKTVTALYKGAVNTLDEEPQWEEIKEEVETVSCDASIADLQPKSFYNWFSGMTNCTSVDLTYLDTTTATAYADMMTDMDSLEWIKIGDSFDLFAKSSDALVSQQYWYDADGDPQSVDYMEGIDTAGTYYTDTSALYNGDGTFKVVLIWDDEANNDGIRPSEVLVKLTRDNATVEGVEMTLTEDETDEDGNWTGTFTGLPKYVNGKEVTYSAKEDITSGYTYRIELLTDGEGKAYVQLTNVHVSVKEDIEITKVWDDADNQDGKRPDSITVRLLVNGSLYREEALTKDTEGVTVSENGNVWKYTMSEIPVDKNGEPIAYTILEVDMDNYNTPVIETIRGNEITDNGVTYRPYSFVVTNSHTPEQIDITGTKVWDDADNQDGKRPQFITLRLYADGVEVADMDVTAANDEDGDGSWEWSFTGLDKYADGEVIKYTVEEDAVEDYDTTITGDASTGFTITNSHVPATTSVSGSKTWVDDDNAQNLRPGEITIRLHANGSEVVDTQTVSETDGWEWEFDNLPVYADGQEIHYTITEDAVDDYVAEYDGYNVTNTLHEGETSVTVVKDWEDADNQDGIRPDSIEVGLWADGVKTDDTLTLSEENGWEGTFEEIAKNSAGTKIVYTIEELTVTDKNGDSDTYETVITGDASEGYVITNSHTPETISLSGSKDWEDNDDQDGIRPDSVTIRLLADGEAVESRSVTADDGWAWTFEDLDKYANGEEITYSMEEVFVRDGYEVTPGDASNDFTFTNTHEPEVIDITGTKTWDDDDDRDGIRPTSITISLLADGNPVSTTVTPDEDGNWTYTFTGFDKYADGEEINYSIEENVPDGYKASYTYSGYDVTNTHSPVLFNGDGTLGVVTHWEDEGDQDGKRPESITLVLSGDADETITLVLNDENTDENGNWIGTFENLYKYAGGEEIKYSVEEGDIDGYTCTAELKYDEDTGLYYIEITNTHEPEQINGETHVLAVTLYWNDDNNTDGLRPLSVTLTLMANGDPVLDENDEPVTLTLDESSADADGNWVGEFDLSGIDLYRYKDGFEISYSVNETDEEGEGLTSDGYTSSAILVLDEETGIWSLEVTNSHTTVTQNITVTKEWKDDSDRDGKRPDAITIHLKANGGSLSDGDVTLTKDNVTVSDGGNKWTYVFEEMPVDENGEAIEYTLTEDTPKDYDSEVDPERGEEITDSGVTYEPYSFTITNTHKIETIDLSGTIVWNDDDNKEGKRPDSVTVHLYADGKEIDKLVVTAEDDWSWIFANLPKYRDGGIEIVYTVEEDPIKGYTEEVVDGDKVIINTLETDQDGTGGTGKGGTGDKPKGTITNNGGNGNQPTSTRGGRTNDTNVLPITLIIIMIAVAAIIVILVVRVTGRRNRRRM